jgi:hypothetical protein
MGEKFLEKLVACWETRGAKPGMGTTLTEIQAFEAKHELLLPADLREYFLRVNGMTTAARGDTDNDGFRFYSLSEVVPLGVVWSPQSEPSPSGLDHLFVIGDFLQECYWYAIRLDRSETEGCSVYFIGPPVRKIAESFERFVELYMSESTLLHPDGSV